MDDSLKDSLAKCKTDAKSASHYREMIPEIVENIVENN